MQIPLANGILLLFGVSFMMAQFLKFWNHENFNWNYIMAFKPEKNEYFFYNGLVV